MFSSTQLFAIWARRSRLISNPQQQQLRGWFLARGREFYWVCLYFKGIGATRGFARMRCAIFFHASLVFRLSLTIGYLYSRCVAKHIYAREVRTSENSPGATARKGHAVGKVALVGLIS